MDYSGRRNQGALRERSFLQCTNLGALIAFILFWCGMVFITAFAVTFGNPGRLLSNVDSFGNVCGHKNTRVYSEITLSGLDLRDRKYLFAMDDQDPWNSLWICVKECPSRRIQDRKGLIAFVRTDGTHLCSYDVPKEAYSRRNLTTMRYPSTSLGPCPITPVVPSKPFRGRCVPVNPSGLYDNTSVAVLDTVEQLDFLQRVAADFMAAYVEIICLCAVAVGLSIFIVACTMFGASLVAYLVYTLVVFGSLGTSIVLWYAYVESVARIEHFEMALASNGTERPLLLYSSRCNQRFVLISAVVSSFMTVLFIAMCVSTARCSGFTAELFQQASRCVRKVPKLLLQPVWTLLVLMVLVVAWGYGASMLATADYVTASNRQANWPYTFNLTFVEYSSLRPVKWFCWYYVGGLIWTAETVLGCEQFVVAATVASYYFSGQTSYSIPDSIHKLLSYHSGTVVLGSLLLPLVKVPRSILPWMKERIEGLDNGQTKECVGCCFRCLGRLHHNAYAIAAVEGSPLWQSARTASGITAAKTVGTGSNVVNTAVTILFLGKCGVAAMVSFTGVLVLKNNPTLQVFMVPLLIACMMAYLIAHSFLTLWEMTIDTLFLCHCGKERITFSDMTASADFGDSALNDFMARICGGIAQPELSADEIALRSFED